MKQLAPMKLLRCLLAAMLTLSLTFCSYAVSYTHLTLPTSDLV